MSLEGQNTGAISRASRNIVHTMSKVGILLLISFIAVFDSYAQAAQSFEDHLNNAVRHIRNKEPDKALEELNAALRLNPRSADAFLLRANVLDNKGDKDGALSDYSMAIELAPAGPGIEVGYNNRSLIRLVKGDLDGALDDINMAIKLNPKIGAFYNQRAIIRLQTEDPDGALADYEKALGLSPNLPSAYYGRGAYHFQKGNFERAIADFDKAIKLMPVYPFAYVSRGLARALNGDMDGAIVDIKNGAVLDARAVSDQSAGKFTSPFKDLSRFITSHPTSARAYEIRGFIRLIQNKAAEAEQDFRKSLELDSHLASEIERISKEIKQANRPR